MGSSAFSADHIEDSLMQDLGSSSQSGERLEIHNVSVDERVAQAKLCGHVHLPTGRTCIGHAGHVGGCRFEAPQLAHEVAQRELGARPRT